MILASCGKKCWWITLALHSHEVESMKLLTLASGRILGGGEMTDL